MQRLRCKSSLTTHLKIHFKQLMSFLKSKNIENDCAVSHLVSLSPLKPGRNSETSSGKAVLQDAPSVPSLRLDLWMLANSAMHLKELQQWNESRQSLARYLQTHVCLNLLRTVTVGLLGTTGVCGELSPRVVTNSYLLFIFSISQICPPHEVV